GAAPFQDTRMVTALEAESQNGNLGERMLIESRRVRPNYFSVVGTRILAGRAFTDADATASLYSDSSGDRSNVAIVSRSMARRFWGTENVVGRRFHFGQLLPKGFWVTVVGVAEDVQFFGLSKGAVDIFYMPVLAFDEFQITVL